MDGQTSNGSMDTSPSRLCESAPNFMSLARSPHEVVSLLPNPSAHLLHEMPALFPNGGDPPNVLSDSMQVSAADLPVNMTMDVLSSPRSLGPAPGFIPDFQQQCDSFGMSAGLDSDMGMDSSTADSQDPSPSIHPITSGYSVGTSSLATALDSMGVSMGRSRAGSTASPGKLMTSIPAIGYPPVNGSLATVDSTGVPFPPTDYSTALNGQHDTSPEVGNDLQSINVGHVLGSIAGYSAGLAGAANSAREAYFVGQSAEVNVKIDELRRAFSFVSDLISKMDASLSFAEPPPIRHTVVTINPNTPTTSSLLGISPTSVEAHAMDVQTNPDILDVSRKRCASSMAGGSGDRVIKAPKMEPQDDDTLAVTPSPTKLLPLSTPLMFTPSAVSVPATVNRSLPPSAPPSRPPTPGNLNVNLLQQPSHILPLPAQPLDFSLPATVPSQSAPPFPVGARNRSSWSDTPTTLPHRHHQHSLSGTSLNTAVNLHGLTTVPSSSTQPFTASGTFGTPSVPGLSNKRPAANASTTISPPLGRITRSGSITTPSVNPISFGFADLPNLDSYDFMPSRSSSSNSAPRRVTPESDEDEETEDDTGDGQQKGSTHSHSSPESGVSGGHGNEVPQEYRVEVDRIFFEFLNKICSNLDASDSKGEPIHQTLMAKKMQRLDESPDFRPFKFRIAAFTNAFLEELARQGYPEEKIPMKKIRNYLWRQEFIQRFNEDGKKAKSKGNHIWNIDAKKGRDGGWIFRPFHRRLAGSPPGIAYVGLKWSWTPRIWDPQAASTHLPVHYSSPILPHWLSWKEDVLSGIPPADAESCDITAEARFVRDGQEEQLSLTFHLSIAPISTLDTSFSPQRRPSLVGLHNPRRVQSDSVVPQVAPRSLLRPQNPASQQTSATSQGAQVMQVLTSAAQRVAQEAQSQVIASLSPSNEPPGHELQALVKQQHVLTMTAAAFDKEYTGHRQDGTPQSPSSVLAAAAHQVVLQAARSVRADRSAAANVAIGCSPQATTSPVTVNEVSVATQSAVAQAVEITGPLSTEVDVLMTATTLLQHHRPPAVDSPQVVAPVESTGHLSTAVPPRNLPLAGINGSVSFPPSLPPLGLPEYVPPS